MEDIMGDTIKFLGIVKNNSLHPSQEALPTEIFEKISIDLVVFPYFVWYIGICYVFSGKTEEKKEDSERKNGRA